MKLSHKKPVSPQDGYIGVGEKNAGCNVPNWFINCLFDGYPIGYQSPVSTSLGFKTIVPYGSLMCSNLPPFAIALS